MDITNLAKDAEEFTGNVWLVENNEEKCLIDAGTGDSWEKIRELEQVDKVVLTHSHYDHVDNLPKILDAWNSEVYSYEPSNLPVDSRELEEGDEVSICGISFEVFHTPGHKDDSVCLYSEEEKILFTGDLVFPEGGFGRTDLDEGDRDRLIASIEKLVDLDVDEFYPGHNSTVTEDAEKWIEKSLEEARKKEPKY